MFILDGKPLLIDHAFTHDDISYPANWLRLSSQADRDAIGITEVADTVRHDDRFYWDHDIPKDLDQLKEQWKAQVDNTAYSMLFQSDWMVIRKLETGKEIPASHASYRAEVRSAANANKIALMAATDITAFIAIATALQWPRYQDFISDGSSLDS